MGNFKGGFPGGGNMQGLIKQAQKMQQQLMEAKEQLAEEEFVGTAGGGLVEVTMNGAKQVVSVSIKPEVVDPDDVEMLEDLLIAAINEVTKQVEAENEKVMGPLSGGMGGLF